MTTPPRQAPLGRRFLAALVNGLVGLTMMAGTGGLFGLFGWLRVRPGPVSRRFGPGQPPDDWIKRLMEGYQRWSKRHRDALFAWNLVNAVHSRGRPSPGHRVLGLRRVDARTGGPVTIRSAVIRFCAQRAWWAASQRILDPPLARTRERQEALEPELKRIFDAHGDDVEARLEAQMALYKQHGVNPQSSCWLSALPVVVPALSPLLPPVHRSLFDRIDGTVVIVDRGLLPLPLSRAPATPTTD